MTTKGDTAKRGCAGLEGGGGADEVEGEGLGVVGEVVGGDAGELLLGESQGAEVEALDLGAVLHVVAGDDAAEGGDEGLGIDGVVLQQGGGQVGVGGAGGRLHGRGHDLGFEVEADGAGVGGALGGVGGFLAGAGGVVIGVEGDEAEELLDVGGGVGAAEVLLLGEGDGDGREGEVVLLVGAEVELVADELLLGVVAGDVAEVDAVFEGGGRGGGPSARRQLCGL